MKKLTKEMVLEALPSESEAITVADLAKALKYEKTWVRSRLNELIAEKTASKKMVVRELEQFGQKYKRQMLHYYK